ncbi:MULTISPECIES: hypothetical protein [pseudomallei group]|uniref:Membrane protein n=1 Tax=Burkholderia oklahomensis TaxID=342113 RepID=A0AAI8FL86_9BURK|nr:MULTISPECIES: hypothetical protein [pseudomallei group]AIO65251.1 putative membrane protein [Burkholderia oklahomensis]AJX32574.1 putative membrane protein [Burkholderia oklahomensis C6786]AOI42395.1 non-ribosomal peptide synthetase [Burkholderia oklahomensis EO147]AOI45960.1 non-ribosomal peptide synthetase [Burkholderia oklahomensis C6786]AOJ56773.1 non-ribosomal peptide synthetase [Burkholderia thailandensis]
MKASRVALNVVATLAVTLVLAKVAGSIQFAPWATDALIRFAGIFGAYGDESVEDVYLVSSLLASLILAIAVVWGANRLVLRPNREK